MRVAERDTPPVTDQAVASARKLIGTQLRRSGLNSLASIQAIRRWNVAVGDRNPLFLDEGYGRKSRYGSMIAPPLWLYTVDDTVVAPGLPGLHSLYTAVDWEFFSPVRVNSDVRVESRLTGVEERDSRFAGRTLTQVGESLYSFGDGRPVARAVSRVDRFGRAEAVRRGFYASLSQRYHYSEDELLAVEDAYDAESIRGDKVLYWEDIEVGEVITPVVKGPLSSEDIITFVTATNPVRTYGGSIRFRERHPLAEFYDVETGRFDAWERSMLDHEVAQQFGFPLAHEAWGQRVSWMASMLTNWMGDDGWLRKLSVQLTRPNLHVDTTWSKGEVVAKAQRDGKAVVVVRLWCENQRGETTAKGTAEVALQSRAVGPLTVSA